MTDIYVPQRVGEGYFTDWQAPIAGNDLVAWAWDNAQAKYVPQVALKITSFVNAAHTHQNAAGGGQLDHGLALTGLGDDDHTQYLLATGTRTGASSQAQAFTSGITAAALSTLTVAQTDGVQFSAALKATYNSTRTSNTSNIYSGVDIAINGTTAAFSEGTLWGTRSIAVAQSTGVTAIAEMDGLITVARTAPTSTMPVTDMIGLQFSASHQGSGLVTNAYGMYGSIVTVAGTTGNITSARVINAFIQHASTTATITNAYDLFLNVPGSTGAITNMYGARIENMGRAGVTNAYGLYLASQSGASTLNFAIVTNNGNIVFNEAGDANTDFRVEGDTDINLLFTDASAESVAIGTNAPTAFFDLKASTTARASQRIRTGTAPTTPNDGDIYHDGALTFYGTDATTAAIVDTLRLRRGSTGTPAAGFGVGFSARLQSSTTANQDAGRLTWKWNVATHASREAYGQLTAFYTTTERPVITWGANSTVALLSFYDVTTPVARQVLATGVAATVDQVISALQALGLVKQS